MKPVLVEKGRTKVIQGPLVIMHHHVALAALVVGQGELGVVHARAGELVESCIELLLLLIFLHFRSTWFTTLGLLESLHDFVRLLILFHLSLDSSSS